MSGQAPDPVVAAAVRAGPFRYLSEAEQATEFRAQQARELLAAVSDVSLGLDRLVSLREVLAVLARMPSQWAHHGRAGAIDWLRMELGGEGE